MRLSLGLPLALLLALLAGLSWLPAESIGTVGRVLDDTGPVAGARVRVKGTATRARTDALGLFHFSSPLAGRRVTAWKEGRLIGGARSGRSPLSIRLARLPAEDNDAYDWVDPAPNAAEAGNCANCHAEIYREWSHSGHSRSVNGRHFRNLYEGTDWNGKAGVGWGLLTQYPDGGGVCASCHAPAAREYDLRQVRGVAAHGVHCDYCHKIAGAHDGPIGLAHGRFNLQLLRPTEGQLFFGPLDDVDRGEDAYSPLYHDSRYCASCHEGVIFGVHVYSTYSEWQVSPARRAGLHCQDCHMKPTGRMTNLAPGHGGIDRDPRTLSNHRFFAGSLETMLRRAVHTSASFEKRADRVRARVRLGADGVGHRVPTGFIDRHLLLVVEGQGLEGLPLAARSGPRLSALAGPELAGKPGRLYGRVLRDPEGRSPAPFWLAAPEPPPDTRLEPGRTDEMELDFPPTLARLRVRVLYRRFWPQTAHEKHWPDQPLLVLERTFSCDGNER
jgi:hypothetical protein